MNETIDTVIQNCCRTAAPSKPFTEGINRAVATIRKENTLDADMHVRVHRSWLPRMAAAAAVAALCVGGTAYAVEKLGLNLWQSDNHQVQVAPASGNPSGTTEPAGSPAAESNPQVIDQYQLNFSYLPSKLSEYTMDVDCGSFDAPGYDGWSQFAPSIQYYTFYLDTDEAAPFSSIARSKLVNIGNQEAAVLDFDYGYEHSERQTQRRLYVAFPEEKRIVRLQTSDKDLYDELDKVAKGMSFAPTGETVDLDLQLVWSNEAEAATYDAEVSAERASHQAVDPWGALSERTFTDEQMGELRTIGEPFSLPSNSDIEITVDQVKLSDSASQLNREEIPFGWRTLIRDDGSLADNIVSFVKFGDGVSTTDTLVKQETAPLKLLSVDITYTNTSTENQDDIWATLCFESVVHENGQWLQYQRVKEHPEADEAQNLLHVNAKRCSYQEVITGEAKLGGGDGDTVNSLGPNESMTIRHYWLINADETDKLLLDIDPNEMNTYTNGTYGQRFVDIRQ